MLRGRASAMKIQWAALYCVLASSISVLAQNSSERLASFTPDVTFLHKIFNTDARFELPDQRTLNKATNQQWVELSINTSNTGLYLFCATSGRAAVEKSLKKFAEEDTLALYSNKTITCFILRSEPAMIQEAIQTSGQYIKYAIPLPPVLKLEKGLFMKVAVGGFLTDRKICSEGILSVFAPGVEQYNRLVDTYISDLASDAYKNKILGQFIWASAYSSSRRLVAVPRRKSRTVLATDGAEEVPIRGKLWSDYLTPVLNGTYACGFAGLNFSIQGSYLHVSNTCTLRKGSSEQASSCMFALLAYLMLDDNILYVQQFPQTELNSNTASGITQSGNADTYSVWDKGLRGEGQVVQVADSGLDVNHCFFRDDSGNVPFTDDISAYYDLSRRKVVQYVAYTDSTEIASGHGTHVSGIIAGNPVNETSPYLGIAPNAKLCIFDVSTPGGLSVPIDVASTLFPPAYKAGARIFSNSWGSSNTFSYNEHAANFDRYQFDNPDVLIVAGVGNDGTKGFFSVRPPGISKNTLSVGSTENVHSSYYDQDTVANFSSLGSTANDFRIKPDVVGPGDFVTSAAASGSLGPTCGTIAKSGTSMSCPLIAGAAALVRQYYTEGWYPSGERNEMDGFIPSGALLKATIINSAVAVSAYRLSGSRVPLTGGPPDPYQGFGRVDLDTALKFNSSLSMFVKDDTELKEREVHTYQFRVPLRMSIPDFRVTLTWTEPPATAFVFYPVFHDLDLYVHSSFTGKTYYANGRSDFGSDGNVEKVVINDTRAGDLLTVYVRGTSITVTGSQRYALVANGLFEYLDPGPFFCFSARDKVLVKGGWCKTMDQLVVGDYIQTLNYEGKLEYSPVVYLPHPHNQIQTTFLEILLEDNKIIRATRDHLIPVFDCDLWRSRRPGQLSSAETLSEKLIAAARVNISDCLLVAMGEMDQRLGLKRVVSITRITDVGVYTAVTTNPFLVVNQIVASPFALNHGIAHKFYHVHRTLYTYVGRGAMESKWVKIFMQMINILLEIYLRLSSGIDGFISGCTHELDHFKYYVNLLILLGLTFTYRSAKRNIFFRGFKEKFP